MSTPQEGLRQRPGDQPLPTPNDRPSSHDQVIELLASRRAIGLERYGSLLQPHNGRRTGRDLLEELADAMVYAQTLDTEIRDLEDKLLAVATVWAMEPGEEKLEALRQVMAEVGELLTQRRVPF